MSIKQIVKYLELKSQLSPEDLAFAERIVSWTEAEKETLAGLLQPVKSKSKPTTTTKRVIEKCATEGCGLTRRAQVHKDSDVEGFHVFLPPTTMRKRDSQRRGMPSSSKEPRCVVCFETQYHSNHDLANGGHEFSTDLAGRVNGVLDGHNKCDTCGRSVDENIHQLTTAQGYHEFVASETAVGAGGD